MKRQTYDNEDEQWAAVVARSTEADGYFYYAVCTTGIFCKPSCPSRVALRKNVSFHATHAEAANAGFRPCKRCRPEQLDDPSVALVTRACRLIESSEIPISLEELAKEVGLSKYHFHRLFKKSTGLTPKAYSSACRDRKVKEEITTKRSITEAIYAAGFNTSGRFYEKSTKILGMTPKKLRAGGKGESIRFAIAECSLGPILIGATNQGICSILLGDTPEEILQIFQDQFPTAELVGGDLEFEGWVANVLAIVDTPGTQLNLPLDIRGTAFQRRVWKALGEIPLGETASYAEIAKQIGSPTSYRAVAQACAANKLAVVIPCHRVVKSDGSLSDYRWGVERKRALLVRERQACEEKFRETPLTTEPRP